jgi:hypothetical protein
MDRGTRKNLFDEFNEQLDVISLVGRVARVILLIAAIVIIFLLLTLNPVFRTATRSGFFY